MANPRLEISASGDSRQGDGPEKGAATGTVTGQLNDSAGGIYSNSTTFKEMQNLPTADLKYSTGTTKAVDQALFGARVVQSITTATIM